MILAERAARLSAESDQRSLDIEIERLKLEIARLKRERFGQSRRKPARRPLPDHLPRLRVVEPAPAAAYAYSPDRGGEHAETLLAGFTGIMQADAFPGFNRLYEKGAIVEAACWAHGRRKFYELAKAPIAIEAVARIDALFAIERDIAGLSVDERLATRAERSRPLVDDLAIWLHHKRAGLSGKADTAKAMDYLLKRWPAFTLFLADGRVDLPNNAAERALRGIAVGRRNWTFAGSDSGGRRAAALYTLIETCKMNGIDPRAWLADVLERLPGHSAQRIDALLPWNWKGETGTLPT